MPRPRSILATYAYDWVTDRTVGTGSAPISERSGTSRPPPPRTSMVVARQALFLGDPLILDGRLQHHALFELGDDAALDFLPRSLVRGILVAAGIHQRLAPGLQLRIVDQHVDRAFLEIDADFVAVLQDGEI